MYSGNRGIWWQSRSKSPEYQKAYKKIAGYVKRQKPQVVLDVGCGIGELARKLHEDNYRLIVAADSCAAMLDEAYEAISSIGAKTAYTKDPSKVSRNGSGIVFVQDDIFNSSLHSGIADTVTITFPELIVEFDENDSDKEVLEAFRKRFGSVEKNTMILAWLRLNSQLSRLARESLIEVRYDISQGKASCLDFLVDKNYRQVIDLFGFEAQDINFYQSPKIHQDTNKDVSDKSNVLRGYRVFVSRKK